MMHWMDVFYSSPVSLPLTIVTMVLIAALSWMGKGRQVILVLTLFLYARYMVWRGMYTLNTADLASTIVSWTVYVAEGYGLLQFIFFVYQAWSPTDRKPVPLRQHPTVDVFITVVNEPIEILKRTVIGCLEQDYPQDKYKVYILDDGERDNVRTLAQSLGCHYLRRLDHQHAKAGNLNHALRHSAGELVALFDVDHVPVRTFLKETVGFFQDQQVAFVQTPHHFYNADIFQRNLRLQNHLTNEQALFFRTLQPGRDRHNSAFFAGSDGVFRRRHLEEIGGFQTDTITEDIHTSLLLHAKGYKSCYLNKVLAAGLMPETFQGFLKQRARWAIGSIQMMFRDNPLTKRGLSLSQRIDYVGSIHYFLHGVPRIVCLVAPLFGLVLHLSPLHTEPLMLLHFFFAYYIASAVAIRTVSRRTRNAFWSDVYETAMCFALSHAVLKTLVAPFRKRPFEITAKGQKIDRRGFEQASSVFPHLFVFGCLVAGMTLGIQTWGSAAQPVGLGINLFWAGANILLLVAAILSAHERPQSRQLLRVGRAFPCDIETAQGRIRASTEDLSEEGVRVVLDRPLAVKEQVRVTLHAPDSNPVVLEGRIARQDRHEKGGVEVGIRFLDAQEPVVRALVHDMFSRPMSWAERKDACLGVLRSFWTLIAVWRVMFLTSRTRRRLAPRIQVAKPCQLRWQGRELWASTADISLNGIAVVLPGQYTVSGEPASLQMEQVTLELRAVASQKQGDKTFVRFDIQAITKGERNWHQLNDVQWSPRAATYVAPRYAQALARIKSLFFACLVAAVLPTFAFGGDAFTGFQIDNKNQYFTYLGLRAPLMHRDAGLEPFVQLFSASLAYTFDAGGGQMRDARAHFIVPSVGLKQTLGSWTVLGFAGPQLRRKEEGLPGGGTAADGQIGTYVQAETFYWHEKRNFHAIASYTDLDRFYWGRVRGKVRAYRASGRCCTTYVGWDATAMGNKDFYAMMTGPLVEVPLGRFFVLARGGYQYMDTFGKGTYTGVEIYTPF